MPTETEITERLKRYGSWLEAELETTLAYSQPEILEQLVIDDVPIAQVEESIERRSGTRLIAAVVCVVVLVAGIAWLGQDQNRPADEVAAENPTPATTIEQEALPTVVPPAPLHLLPESLDTFRTSGFESEEALSGESETAIIVGRPRRGGYSDVSVLQLVEAASFQGIEAETATIAGRTVKIAAYDPLDPNPSIAFESDDGGWIEILPASAELRTPLIEAVSVVDGELRFSPVNGLQELDRIDESTTFGFGFASLRGGPASDAYLNIVVRSTADATEFSFPFAGVGEIETVTVRGHDGFVTERDSPPFSTFTSLSWFEQPGQLITLYASSDVDVFEVAEGLRIVDKDTWMAELSALEEVDPNENMGGVRIFPFSLIDDEGDQVDLAPDGSPTVLIAGQPDCAECLVTLAAIDALRDETGPAVRFVAVPLEGSTGWGDGPEWSGDTWMLRDDATEVLRTPLEARGILVLDGDNNTVLSIAVGSPNAVDRLKLVLDTLL